MFHRGCVSQKRGLLKQRRYRKKASMLHLPEWDSTVHDLTVYAASPEEILQKRLRRKSKNADAARRDLKAKQQGIPPDMMLSPGQVELEMRKLAVLREVLYDHNDLNEVLRRTDQTMASVKGIFHDSTTRKAGNMNITLAPGKRCNPPVSVPVDRPSKLDALSDSVMDNQALNDDTSQDSEFEDDVQFESKVDCSRFLGLLKDTMNKVPAAALEEGTKTPDNKPPVAQERALNCTEEVKRTLSQISSIRNDETTSSAPNESKAENQPQEVRKIDRAIAQISKDAAKLQKNLNASAVSTIKLTNLPPRTSIEACNMTYDRLQDAVKEVQRGIAEIDERNGRISGGQVSASDGLAGFTATLIDAVTRLTAYVNEGELKHQEMNKAFSGLQEKLDHQVALSDALTLELMKTQKQLADEKERRNMLEVKLSKKLESADEAWRKKIDEIEAKVGEVTHTLTVAERNQDEAGVVDEQLDDGSAITLLQADTKASGNTGKAESDGDSALKSDMLRLLNALKKENNEKQSYNDQGLPQARMPLPAALLPPSTQEAAETIASVESHLRHLRLQHAEARNRMSELTRHAQLYDAPDPQHSGAAVAPSAVDARSSTSSQSDATSLAPLPAKLLPSSKPVPVQTNVASHPDPQAYSLSPPSHDVPSDGPEKRAVLPDTGKPGLTFADSDSESFHFLEQDSGDTESTLSARDDDVAQSPHVSRQQQAMLSNIQKAQVSLEDRIAELNKQHSEAQRRLQSLVARRRNETCRRIQVSVPSVEMLQTPQTSKAGLNGDSQSDMSSSWTSLLRT